jgi:hypothetical protein
VSRTGSDAIEVNLDHLFDRVERMTDSELVLLRAVWEQLDAHAREDAWAIVRSVVKRRKRDRLLDDARDRLTRWINNYLSAAAVEYGTLLINPGSGMDASSVRRAAIPPLMDAAAAVVAADELNSGLRALLLEPLTVVGGRGQAR